MKQEKRTGINLLSPICVRLHESQARIKISERNINNFKYADDITVIAESEEGLKSLLMKVKEESEKAGLKLKCAKLR